MKKGKLFFEVLVGIWFFFIVAPSMVLYALFFQRKKPLQLLDVDPEKAYFQGKEEAFRKAYYFLKNLPKQEISMRTKDGVLLKGEYCENTGKKAVILLHGYRSDPYVNFAALSEIMWEQGYDLYLLSSRGHLPSEGSCSMGILESEDLVEWVKMIQKDHDKEVILVGGVSMGTATVSYASSHLAGVQGLILDCGFYSPYQQMLYECQRRHLPTRWMMPVMRLCGIIHLKKDIKAPVCDSLEKNTIPALFIHGKADETVPFSDGLRIYESCASEKECLFVENAPHTAGLIYAGLEGKETLCQFIKKCENGCDMEA